jgi:hypothetical protein
MTRFIPFRVWRPAAERAADPQAGRIVGLIDCSFGVQLSVGDVVRHSRYYRTYECAN